MVCSARLSAGLAALLPQLAGQLKPSADTLKANGFEMHRGKQRWPER